MMWGYLLSFVAGGIVGLTVVCCAVAGGNSDKK